jgi:hypothetical protein
VGQAFSAGRAARRRRPSKRRRDDFSCASPYCCPAPFNAAARPFSRRWKGVDSTIPFSRVETFRHPA